MSGFDAAWLRLREPFDAASRNRALVDTLAQLLPERPIDVIDLATGSAANLRYLSPLLGGAQYWHLIDDDTDLLATIPTRLTEWAAQQQARAHSSDEAIEIEAPTFECRVRTTQIDLAAGIEAVEIPQRALVTASALLDLVSESWLRTLAKRCHTSRATVLLVLTYDGRIRFDPRDPHDETLINLVNWHQLGDKGFGPALGPTAAPRAVAAFEAQGFRVERARSDWHIRNDAREMQTALLDGWLAAASEAGPEQVPVLERWAQRRRSLIERGSSSLRVGHADLLAWLPG